MDHIRMATIRDLGRIAEIEIFNYRLYFYPLFRNDSFYFDELQVANQIVKYKQSPNSLLLYDDGVIKGFIQVENQQIKKTVCSAYFAK